MVIVIHSRSGKSFAAQEEKGPVESQLSPSPPLLASASVRHASLLLLGLKTHNRRQGFSLCTVDDRQDRQDPREDVRKTVV